MYRLVEKGNAKNLIKMHLPRAVHHKPRTKHTDGKAGCIPRALLEGRTYNDFRELDEHLRAAAVECARVWESAR